MSDQQITVKPNALFQLLSDVSRTAGTDFTLPMLNGVMLQVDPRDKGKALVGTSTNRFVLGQAEIDAAGEMPPTFLALDRVKQLLGILRPYAKSGDMACEVRRDPENLTLSLPGDLALPALSVTVPVGGVTPEFPKVGHLLPKACDAQPGGQVAFNPRYLSTFCAIAKGRGTELRVIPNAPEKPQLVLVGDAYRALIMPVRTQESTDITWVLPASGREKKTAEPVAAAEG